MIFRTFSLCGLLAAALPAGAMAAGAMPTPPVASRSAAIPVANADNPQTNVNPKVDAGNSTGDSKVDNLNAGQLNRNYRGPAYAPGQTKPGPGSATPSPAAPTAPGATK